MSKKTILRLAGAYLLSLVAAWAVLWWGFGSGWIRVAPHDRVVGPIILTIAAAFVLFFLFAVICIGVWVHGDARRRGMEPLLWALIAILGPNFLGLVAYLVVRKPLRLPCPSCGQNMPEGASFCPHCRAPQRRLCSACQTPSPDDARFCPHCGATLPDTPPTPS